MKHVTIIVPDGQVNMGTAATIIGTIEIFTEADSYWRKMGNPANCSIHTAGVSEKVSFSKGMMTFQPELNISDIKKTDLILVPPSGIRSDNDIQKGNRTIISWIKKQYKLGAEVASMCSGIFMLAASGILDGKTCSAHWAHAETFRNSFPGINLNDGKLITAESGIYTNGGAYSFLNLVILLIEEYYDKQTAIYCTKMFQIEIDRYTQSSFAIFSGQKKHDDDVILKAQTYIEKNYRNKITIEFLSNKFSVGRRNFDRRFIKATGITPLDYLQRVKIESAKKSLENTRKTVNEVMYEVGYSDIKAFREVFNRVTGLSPLAYKSKYNKGS
ncbi:MAG: transcriptional regulator, AraC family [Bacteroidetes bacterium]|jgi:transcriptional regulator GlxA family with amidase domain|nr:transcriptional regulator, AraC family [Bacteroidota bacterium]